MKIAIQGHSARFKEVIDILINLGGTNKLNYEGNDSSLYYYIDKFKHIQTQFISKTDTNSYKCYTLEEFEKEFPFKIGDIVQTAPNGQAGIITELCLDPTYIIVYKVRYNSKRELLFHAQMLKLYTPMKKERNITLTLDKAKEWYQKGGELKEVALQAYTKEELNPLPKSWEEYCKTHIVPAMIFGPYVPNKYIALWKLEQLRDCYRQGWEPDWTKNTPITSIYSTNKIIGITNLFSKHFLSFQSEEVAKEFKKNFEPLIKEAEEFI